MQTPTANPPAPAAPAHARTAFRQLPFMGVIRVNNEAMKVGWVMGDPKWSNLGQGQPEVGPLAGAPERWTRFTVEPTDHAYGPVEGTRELREAVAAHYNRLYRKGKPSQYTFENVCIAPGGRAALTRIGAALDNVKLGYFTPDYTAYEDLLTTFHRLNPQWIELTPDKRFHIPPADLDARVQRDGLGALLISNPCNPTGVAVRGQELAAWVEMSRKRNCTLLMDEFYSHYVYTPDHPGPVSAAAYVNDVNTDPVVVIDGLTKCFRYPGWRLGWVVAPKSVIQALTAAGSFLDGGTSRPVQRAAIEVLKPERCDQETQAVRTVFTEKQKLTVSRLREMGVEFAGEPEGTFYAWGNISKLPAPINTGEGFMREGFKHQVLTVPGEYFDVNPNRNRTAKSPLTPWVRFSFGPPRDNLEAGLSRLAEMVKKHSK